MARLTSRELIERAGISRATLNNYIALGLLPRPDVTPPRDQSSRARRIGYFPAEALEVLLRVRSMKEEGISMDQIVDTLAVTLDDSSTTPSQPSGAPQDSGTPGASGSAVQRASDGPRLTLMDFEQPAYLVNAKFEIEWWNDAAEDRFLTPGGKVANEMGGRSLFSTFFVGSCLRGAEGRMEVLRFHLAIAKTRLSKSALFSAEQGVDAALSQELGSIYDEVDAVKSREMTFTEVNFAEPGAAPDWYRLYAVFFREGTLFSYVPAESSSDAMVSLLSRRDLVIRDILRSRRPYLTQLAVLVADLQSSVKICAELPAEEYFQLINDIWDAMGAKLRTHYATHGKHVGDGMVYYFFPQPDSNYVLNALRCAHEMKTIMQGISREWKKRKNWNNDLVLNIGLVEGREWFGTYQTPTHIEFTVLGDTINMAGRLSDFARDGSVWVTKSMLGQLTSKERETLSFGIRRADRNGDEILVSNTYSRISNLVDLDNPKYEKFNDIAALPVAECLDVDIPAD